MTFRCLYLIGFHFPLSYRALGLELMISRCLVSHCSWRYDPLLWSKSTFAKWFAHRRQKKKNPLPLPSVTKHAQQKWVNSPVFWMPSTNNFLLNHLDEAIWVLLKWMIWGYHYFLETPISAIIVENARRAS